MNYEVPFFSSPEILSMVRVVYGKAKVMGKVNLDTLLTIERFS